MEANTQDHIDQLVSQSLSTTIIVGNPATGEFELLDLMGPEEDRQSLSTRGLSFIGVFCVGSDGEVRSGFDVELGPIAIKTLVRAFMDRMRTRIAAPKIEDADWLAKLWALPDPRTAN